MVAWKWNSNRNSWGITNRFVFALQHRLCRPVLFPVDWWPLIIQRCRWKNLSENVIVTFSILPHSQASLTIDNLLDFVEQTFEIFNVRVFDQIVARGFTQRWENIHTGGLGWTSRKWLVLCYEPRAHIVDWQVGTVVFQVGLVELIPVHWKMMERIFFFDLSVDF